MFNENKYTKTYFKIIENSAKKDFSDTKERLEKHHIIPRSMGGTDNDDNLVFLTLREHYVVHWLLTKMCQEDLHVAKMKTAFMLMCSRALNGGVRVPSRVYARIKSEKLLNSYRVDCYNPDTEEYKTFNLDKEEDIPYPWIKKGKPKSEDHKDKIRQAHAGKSKDQAKARGKKWYYNPQTNEKTQVLVGQEVPEGFVVGIGNNKDNSGYRTWFCESTGEYVSSKECPGEGWIKRGKPKSQEAVKKRLKTLAKNREEGKVKSVKGMMWIHNIETNKTKRIDSDENIPEGWLEGLSSIHKEKISESKKGRKQTENQKNSVRSANSYDYFITFSSGKTKVFKNMGLREISIQLGFSRDTMSNIYFGRVRGEPKGILKIGKVEE